MEYNKVKSAAKIVLPRGPKLKDLVLETTGDCSEIVGGTLGPGGMMVLIERPEHGLPPYWTKDGVSVFKQIGFQNAVKHTVCEAIREASVKTAREAGDGPQPLWAKVLTPSGYVEMRDMMVGMEICGTMGTVQKVLGVFPKGKKEIVRVTFGQGRVVECCEDHLWTVYCGDRGVLKTLTTAQMSVDFSKKQLDGSSKHKYFIPNTVAEFKNNQALPLDPYLLGVLIGDGSLCDSGSVELSLGLPKEHIIKKLILPKGLELRTSYVDDKNSFRIKISGNKAENGLNIRQMLESIGLRNSNSYTKHIPSAYLNNSIEVRMGLLQGLIDTDGHVNDRGLFEFSTSSEQLAADFKYLCRSLGIHLSTWTHHNSKATGGYSDRVSYRFSQLKGNRYGVQIENIEKTGEFTEMQCIKVSNPDNLYITDDFIVTHNTTSATILVDAFVNEIYEYCERNPKKSPQRILRDIGKIVETKVLPFIQSKIIKPTPDFTDLENAGTKVYNGVATISANGDKELAKAVIEAYGIVGDFGNVTIVEEGGDPSVQAKRIEGYPIHLGYEELGQYYPMFINDHGRQMVVLEKPYFVVVHGKVTHLHGLTKLLAPMIEDYGMTQEGYIDEQGNRVRPKSQFKSYNVVVIATDFSDQVKSAMGAMMKGPHPVKWYPIKVPMLPTHNGQMEYLQDIAAVTGAKMFDNFNYSLEDGTIEDIGPGLDLFEASRQNSTIFGRPEGTVYEDRLLERVYEVETRLQTPISEMDRLWLQERFGRLSDGVAQLIITGQSNGELKERRDRADDAICAVKGALNDGVLPGGGWTYVQIGKMLGNTDEEELLRQVLMSPFLKLLDNAGLTQEEIEAVFGRMKEDVDLVYDAARHEFVNPHENYLYDSAPAVVKAIKNSLSAAAVGTLAGVICQPRHTELEREEASKEIAFQQAGQESEV